MESDGFMIPIMGNSSVMHLNTSATPGYVETSNAMEMTPLKITPI